MRHLASVHSFDKWRLIPVVDDGYRVIDAILTYF